MFNRGVATIVAFASAVGCSGRNTASMVEKTTVCELAKSAEEMNGHTVRLLAIYITDLRHKTILKDRQCNSVSLVVLDAEEPLDKSLEEFDEAVWGEIDDLDLRIFHVDASGVFAQSSGDVPMAFQLQKVSVFRRLRGSDWKSAE